MKLLSAFLVALLIITYVHCESKEDATLDEQWIMFKQKFGKTYKSGNEERKLIFGANLKRLQDYNKKFEEGLVDTKAEIDISTDLTDEELKRLNGTRPW